MIKRICIVTFAWPPRNSIAAHRPYSWAKYWSARGVHVRVVTAKKYAYDAPLDLNLPDLPNVEVIEVDYGRAAGKLSKSILKGRVLGHVRKLYRWLRKCTALPNPRDAWVSACTPYTDRWAQECDCVVSTYDPRGVHQIAAQMKTHNPRVIWVADYRDLWSESHVANWSDAQRAIERKLEMSTVGELADFVTSVSDELAAVQGQLLTKPYLTITNGFDTDLQELKAALRRGPPPLDSPMKIVYTGKIYPNSQDATPLLDTIVDMEESGSISRSSIELHVYGGQVEGIEAALRTGRYNHFVHMHGHVARDEALRAQSNAHLLLLLESSRPEASGVLTGKLFEYVSSGVPVISLGSRKGSAIDRVLKATRTGICTEDHPKVIGEVLRARLEGGGLAWFQPTEEAILVYTRQRQARLLLEEITSFKSRSQTSA